VAALVALGERYWALGLVAAARGAFEQAHAAAEAKDATAARLLAGFIFNKEKSHTFNEDQRSTSVAGGVIESRLEQALRPPAVLLIRMRASPAGF